MGNAAVMGFVPRFRYVLLSDLLLETMQDEQIEAIFAHELGHVMHRHLFWLVAAMAAMFLAVAGPGQMIANALQPLQSRAWLGDSVQTALSLGAAIGLFALVFGYVSRKFERQADVFAARTIQNVLDAAAEPVPASPSAMQPTPANPDVLRSVLANTAVLDEPGITLAAPPRSYVGRQGATIFCSALERVAVVNNIPIAARSWCHGSIAKRMRFLEYLARDARRTTQFDRFMSRFYVALILSLCVFAGWTMLVLKA
jgi:STE24 endopeptidase